MLDGLAQSSDERVSVVAEKVIREVRYHIDRSRDLVIGLGDGREESRARMQGALDALWPFTADLLATDEIDAELQAKGIVTDPAPVADAFRAEIEATFAAARLSMPETGLALTGGHNGVHSEHMGYIPEHMGYILAEMQYLQRAYPGVIW